MSISEAEMMAMIKRSPVEFIQFLKENKIDFKKTAQDLDFARTVVKERYSMSQENIDGVEFVFWFSYFVEREARDLIVEPEVQLGSRREAIELMTDKLHFGEKISIITKLYTNEKDDFVKLMWKVNELRNDVAHGRFDKLEYKGESLSHAGGQLLITADLMNYLQKK